VKVFGQKVFLQNCAPPSGGSRMNKRHQKLMMKIHGTKGLRSMELRDLVASERLLEMSELSLLVVAYEPNSIDEPKI